MELYFQNNKGKEKLIAAPNGFNDLWLKINEYLDQIGVKSYYTRVINHNTEFKIDYGSHTEFFIVKEVSNIEDVIGKGMED